MSAPNLAARRSGGAGVGHRVGDGAGRRPPRRMIGASPSRISPRSRAGETMSVTARNVGKLSYREPQPLEGLLLAQHT